MDRNSAVSLAVDSIYIYISFCRFSHHGPVPRSAQLRVACCAADSSVPDHHGTGPAGKAARVCRDSYTSPATGIRHDTTRAM